MSPFIYKEILPEITVDNVIDALSELLEIMPSPIEVIDEVLDDIDQTVATNRIQPEFEENA